MTDKTIRILSIGAAVQDVFLSHSEEFAAVCENPQDCFMQLELGAKADVNNITFSTGGGATNAAVTFARGGLSSMFMGTVSHDPAGQAVLMDLDKENVDTTHVSYSTKHKTGYSVLLLAPNGERTILTYRGASTHYEAEYFNLDNIDVDWLYVSSVAGQMNILDKLFRQAREKNVKIFFNPGKGELKEIAKLKGLLEDVSVLSVNKEEMQQIVHGETSEELVRHGLQYVDTVIVSDGPNGVVASDGKTLVSAGMYEDVEVSDRTGAGDAFGSGFLSKWAQGASLKESIIFGSANSTNVVTKVGAKAGILSGNAKLHDMPLTEVQL